MKIIIVITIIIIITIIKITPVLAFENNIGYSKIHPAAPFYFLKAIRENLELKFAQTTRVKYLRQLEFAIRRLRESKTLINVKQEDLIPPTLERYAAYLNSLPDKHQKNDEFVPIIKNNLAVHLHTLQQLYDDSNSPRAKMFIRSTMNRIIQRADVSDEAKGVVCDFFNKEASSSALNQTEQVVLKQRALRCFEKLTPRL